MKNMKPLSIEQTKEIRGSGGPLIVGSLAVVGIVIGLVNGTSAKYADKS